MNLCLLTGNTTKDVEKVQGKNKEFAKLRVAIDSGKNDKTLFVNVLAFDSALRDIEYYSIAKGDKVQIEGRISEDSFTKKDGTEVQSFQIIASSVLKIARPVTTGPSF